MLRLSEYHVCACDATSYKCKLSIIEIRNIHLFDYICGILLDMRLIPKTEELFTTTAITITSIKDIKLTKLYIITVKDLLSHY